MSDSRKIQWHLILELGLTVVGFCFIPVLAGIFLDWRFGTAPIVTLTMMFLGLNLGIIAIYRRIGIIYLQLAPPDPDEKSKPFGGDPC